MCRLHGGATRHVQRKAQERLAFEKVLLLERAVRGVAPDPSAAPADKRLAKAVAKRAGKPIRRAASRPAGPPTPAAPAPPPERPAEPAVAHPERPEDVRTAPAPPRPARPAFAEPTEPPSRGLTTAEDALADVAAANRRAGVSQRRRRRR
ncbi:hypothetical protein SRL2020028_27520 [Mycobacterium kiyosense]|uniref:Uncharacterized protein n=1 Tax=Mycobacterium kiyosense TaxID=2871094 RepID=A0AA37Q542_9MYCO|nr:hypothetical protein SRL2020028_27520 [Mycobacterium kiyosense]GLD37221.1 hypothetical protein Mkiyose1595_34410 [Mycobacterium kiyosense]